MSLSFLPALSALLALSLLSKSATTGPGAVSADVVLPVLGAACKPSRICLKRLDSRVIALGIVYATVIVVLGFLVLLLSPRLFRHYGL